MAESLERSAGAAAGDGRWLSRTSARDLQSIADYLARRDIVSLLPSKLRRRFDVLVLCGSSVLTSLDIAAHAYHQGSVTHILVSGGIGHSFPHLMAAVTAHPRYSRAALRDRSEAEILAAILVSQLEVPRSAVTTETQSTNCGENAERTLDLLSGWSTSPSVVLMQDPTMQRRTHASFEHHQRHRARALRLASFAPFVPKVAPSAEQVVDAGGAPAWGLDRFTSLALGEVRRLHDDEHGYGPNGAGFIDHVSVPQHVLAAASRVRQVAPPSLLER